MLGSGEESRASELIDSEMAGRIRLKGGGIVEGMQENDLAKAFFGSVNVGRGQVHRLKELGTRTPASLGGMSHPLLPLS